MADGITISLGDALPYFEEKFLRLIGKDHETEDLKSWFRSLQTTALEQTAFVKCVGMQRAIPFENIYQPTRLYLGPEAVEKVVSRSYAHHNRVSRSLVAARMLEERSLTADELLQKDEDAIIYAKPGWGKTTLLHHIFRSNWRSESLLPILITLRREGAIHDLARYVAECEKIQKRQNRPCTLLLVDGYDEISPAERRQVSDLLLKFEALRVGKFYLSCREYYEVALVSAPHVHVGRFSEEDKIRFVTAFLKVYESKYEPHAMLNELASKGFSDFLSHPLMLTLACIVKGSSSSIQPRSSLRLLERALDVLCYRWDEGKIIARQKTT
jgi:hypothetical protein